MTMEAELLTIITGYHADNYFAGGDISQKRLQSAIQNLGVDPRDTVLAIIDATILGFTKNGSAGNGMAITPRGIFWKNIWAVPTRRNHYTWEELAPAADTWEVHSGNVVFEPGVQYGSTGEFKAPQVVNLLRAITAFYLEWKEEGAMPAAPTPAAREAPISRPALSDPRIGAAEYTTALVNGLALAVCALGTIDEPCLELAIEFIRSDEIVVDGGPAMERFSEVVEQITADAARSTAFLKLRQGKLLAACHPLNDPHLAERIAIMLDGVTEAAPAERQHQLADIKRRLMECVGH